LLNVAPQKFDETPVGTDASLDQARKAVSQVLKGIVFDVSNVPETHPALQSNEMLELQISDLKEVSEKHLKGTVSCFQTLSAGYSLAI
jgi:hypothetical protein